MVETYNGLMFHSQIGNRLCWPVVKHFWLRYTQNDMKKISEQHGVIISPSIVVFSVLFVLGIYFVFFIRQILLMLFLAVIMMAALNPALKWMVRSLHLPKFLAIAILYFGVILVLGMTITMIIPPLLADVPQFVNTLSLPPLPEHIRQLNFSLNELTSIFNQIGGSFGAVYQVVSSTFAGIFSFFTVLVMACYLLIERDNLHKKIVWFSQEQRHLDIAKELVDTVEAQLGGWVRGQFFLMATIGIVSYTGLSLLNVKYALPLALAAGLLEILPNLGPTLAALPAIVVAYLQYGAPMAGFVTLFYAVVQQLENNLIVPKIMKDNVDVSPLVTILMILIGFKASGVVGALLSVPIYIVIRSVYTIWLRERDRW
jgi:predicted PurR-regulated permease PerM